MRSVRAGVKALPWLLEKVQPAVRYRALLGLLDRPCNDPEVLEARSQIPRRGWGSDILRSQKRGGFWESAPDLYRPKYTATIWRLIVLADLGLTTEDPRMKKTCDLMLEEYSRADGGFDSPGDESQPSELCVTGNLTRTFIRCGLWDDPRVRAAAEWLVRNQKDDGGWHCFGEKARGAGTLDGWEGLSAFAALPRARWTRGIRRSIERGAEFYLARELLTEGPRQYLPWTRLHYPVHYYYDVLVGLEVLTRLGYGGDRRLRPALELLKSKQRADGTWRLERLHPDLGWGAGYRLKKDRIRRFSLEKEGEPSKWITLRALEVLRSVENSGNRGS